jgi:hypothetical protein
MAGEARDLQDAVVERLVPQPLALFTAKVSTRAFSALTIPRTVLLCKDDAVLPTEAYLSMAENLGQFDLIEVAGGHETLFCRPEVVAEALIRAAETGD